MTDLTLQKHLQEISLWVLLRTLHTRVPEFIWKHFRSKLASNYANSPLIDSLTSMFNLNKFLVNINTTWRLLSVKAHSMHPNAWLFVSTRSSFGKIKESIIYWGFTITFCTKWSNKDILKAFQRKRQENALEHKPVRFSPLCRCC